VKVTEAEADAAGGEMPFDLRDCEIGDGEEGRATDETDGTRMLLKACRLIPSMPIRVIRGSFAILSQSLRGRQTAGVSLLIFIIV
jgi:hypothetical protein